MESPRWGVRGVAAVRDDHSRCQSRPAPARYATGSAPTRGSRWRTITRLIAEVDAGGLLAESAAMIPLEPGPIGGKEHLDAELMAPSVEGEAKSGIIGRVASDL